MHNFLLLPVLESECFVFITGKKFGIDASNKILITEDGAEVETIDVLRDNDKLFVVEDEEFILLDKKFKDFSFQSVSDAA